MPATGIVAVGCAAAPRVFSPIALSYGNSHQPAEFSKVPPGLLEAQMKKAITLSVVLLCVLAGFPAMYAQSVTGQISGTVADSTGAVVAGAHVQLTHDLSQQV